MSAFPLLNFPSPCSISDQCGGCQLQHQQYDNQIQFKSNFLINSIKSAELLTPDELKLNINPFIKAERPFFYRNKIQCAVGKENNQIKIGLYQSHSHRIVSTKHCEIQHPIINKILQDCHKFFEANLDLSIYNETAHEGLIRHIVIRAGFYTNETLLCFVMTKKNTVYENLINSFFKNTPYITGLLININPDRTDRILGKENVFISGKETFTEKINNYIFGTTIDSFLQLNTYQCEVLYNTVIKCAQFKKTDIVLDAYCGVGTISISIAKQVKKVIGIESVQNAIDIAKDNAKHNKIHNCDFICGLTENFLEKYYEDSTKDLPDIVIIDPPRKGCDQHVIKLFLKYKPKKIIYISCHCKTLIRDLKLLKQAYNINSIQGIDMFPQTHHIESITCLERKN